MKIQYQIILGALPHPSLLLQQNANGYGIVDVNGSLCRLLAKSRQHYVDIDLTDSNLFSADESFLLTAAIEKCIPNQTTATITTSYGPVVIVPVYDEKGNSLYEIICISSLSREEVAAEIHRLQTDICINNISEDNSSLTQLHLVVSQENGGKQNVDRDLLQYKNIIEQSKDGICLMDKSSKPFFMNAAFEKLITGTTDCLYKQDGVLGLYKDKQQAADLLLTVFSGNHWAGDMQLVKESGETADFYVSAGPVKNGEDEVTSFYNVYTDITDRKQLERELRDNNQQMAVILECITDAFCALDNNWVITIWNKEAENTTGISRKKVIGRTLPDAFPEIAGMELYALFQNAKKQNVIKSYEGYIDTLGKWVKLTAYPSEGGLTIYFRNITEAKKAAEDIKNANAENLQILESIGDAFFTVNRNWTVTYWNKEAEKILKTRRESILGKNLWEVFAEKIPVAFHSIHDAALKEDVVLNFEEYYPSLNIWVEVSAYPSSKGVSVYFKDISERKLAQENILRVNQQLEWAEQMGKLGYWKIDLQTKEIFWSKEVFRIWGIEANDQGPDYETFYGSVHPDDKALFDRAIEEALDSGVIQTLEYRIVLNNGVIKWVQEKGVVLFRKEKQPVLEGIVRDITEEKENELQVKLSNERYDYASKASSDAIWDWDLAANKMYWTEGHERLFGYKLNNANAEKNVVAWQQCIHPDDIGRITKSLRKNLKDASSSVWQSEYRYLKANGEYAYIHDRAYTIFDESERPVRMIGAMRDITAKKSEEHQLKLLESVITNTSDVVIITDAPLNNSTPSIVYINNAFTTLTGYSKEEVIGKPVEMFRGQKTCNRELVKLRRAMKQWKPCEIEVINYKKNGGIYWVNISVVPVADKSGAFTHWIAIERDITDRKKSELEKDQLIKELTQYNKELKQFSYITTHNLRAPLTNLMSIADLIDYDSITDETMRLLMDGFKKSTFLLNETIDDLIKVLIIKEKNNPAMELLHFNDVWNSIASAAMPLVKKSNATILVDFSEIETVYFNKSYLESIFINLLSNSLKYSVPGRNPEISVTTRMENNCVQLIFKDNGLGFDLKRIGDRIFGLYQRFYNRPDSKGIGLFLVHSQVTSAGGKINLESKLNQGSIFTITFKPL